MHALCTVKWACPLSVTKGDRFALSSQGSLHPCALSLGGVGTGLAGFHVHHV